LFAFDFQIMGKPFFGPEPTAPPLVEQPNDSSYVDFIILGNKENFSVRADKLSIINSNTELSRLVKAEKYTINHGNVNPSNFESLVRFIETKFIRFSDDIKTTLNVLELASIFQCQELVIACVKELDLKLSAENVLDVFKALRYYSTQTAFVNQPVTAEDYLNAMLSNSLQFIDQHAAEILTQSDLSTLRFEELELIIKRKALQLPSETILFNLVVEWSSKECERKMIEPSEENRQKVLGGLIYAPRYLLMSYDDFKKCRDRVSLIDPPEIQLIENVFNKKKSSTLTDEQNSMLENFSEPRSPFAAMPIHLSARSDPKKYPAKMRKYAKKLAQGREKRSENCLLNCISVFACIFE
jgi:BTB And C-terminal Kelch/BTB/POZ domain